MLIEDKYYYLHFITRTRQKFTQRTTKTVTPLKQRGLGKCIFPGPLYVLKITNLRSHLTGDSNNISKLEQT